MFVVVEKDELNTPVEELYARGNVALREEELILLLKVTQSIVFKHPATPEEAVAQPRVPPEPI